jgi:hypothetical protein
MASLSHVTAMFQHPLLTTLSDVNFHSLTVLQRELNANASSIHSQRGSGTHGHLVLVCRPTVFAVISPTAFIPPTNPGPPPAPGLAAAARTVQLAEHKAQLDEFNLYTFVDSALRQQLIKAVPSIHIKALEDPTLGYSNISTLTLMTHLWAQYGTITADELQHNSVALNAPTWDPTTPIELLFTRVQDHADFATAGGAPIPDPLLAQAAYSNIEHTGLYPTYCDAWRAKPTADRTWANCKVYFTTANKDLHRHTTSSAGYHSAHAVRATTTTTTDPMTHLRSDMANIQSEMLALRLSLTEPRPEPTPTKQKFYCHTHGISTNADHTSQTCRTRGPNHQVTATLRNKMGGSTRERK